MRVVLPDLQLDYFPINIRVIPGRTLRKNRAFSWPHHDQSIRHKCQEGCTQDGFERSRPANQGHSTYPGKVFHPLSQISNKTMGVPQGLTVSKRDNSVQSVEDHWGVNHFVVVQFPQILHLGDSALVELELVMLEAQGDLLEYIVDNHNDEILVVTVERSNQDSKEVDIAVLHFPWLGKYLLHDVDNL